LILIVSGEGQRFAIIDVTGMIPMRPFGGPFELGHASSRRRVASTAALIACSLPSQRRSEAACPLLLTLRINMEIVWFLVVVATLVLAIFMVERIGKRLEELKETASKDLEWAVQQLETNPKSKSTGIRFLSRVTGLIFLPADRKLYVLEKSLSILQTHSADTEVQKEFIKYLASVEWQRATAYRSVLNLLATNSEPYMKQFVLDVARWHYSKGRKDGKLTVYDEQAIQNDILMNLKS
jgi:hypothetical protein